MITNELISIIYEIRDAATPKSKQAVLEKYKDNTSLKDVLFYTFNPYLKYGLTSKTIAKFTTTGDAIDQPFERVLNVLAMSNINDRLRQEFVNYINKFDYDTAAIMIDIVCKDLKLGISETTVNKVWPKHIPSFDLQLAAKFDNVKLDLDEYIWITEKFDGIRCVCIVDENGKIQFFTRQGKEITGLLDITAEISKFRFTNIVYDGELVFNKEAKDSGERYRFTTKIVNSKLEDKKDITFNMFDMINLDEFKIGEGKVKYSRRRELLDTKIPQSEVISVAPVLYEGTDHSMVIVILNQMILELKEGCMVNRDHVYQCKRTKSLLKVKKMNDADLKVIGYEEGRGENEGRLGAFVVSYKGFPVNVGSGFSKDQREEYWQNKNEMIGQIIKVQYFEETNNQNGGTSLRFPVFLEWRQDKTEPSYN